MPPRHEELLWRVFHLDESSPAQRGILGVRPFIDPGCRSTPLAFEVDSGPTFVPRGNLGTATPVVAQGNHASGSTEIELRVELMTSCVSRDHRFVFINPWGW